MQPQDTGYRYIRQGPYIVPIPNTGSLPPGVTEVSFQEFINTANNAVNDPKGVQWKEFYDDVKKQVPTAFQPNAQSGIIMVNGIPWRKEDYEKSQAIASDPNMINIGTPEAPQYVPKGSAGAENVKNFGTQNTANEANKQTTTGASSASTPSSTSAVTKPTGINLITSTLNLGSQGDQVKALQQYLSGIGYLGSDGKPLKADGIFGPETKTAVMQFQSKNGLTPDGVFGPKSLEKTKTITSTSTQADSASPGSSAPGSTSNSIDTTNPNDGGTVYNTGDPTQDALLAELQKYIKEQQAAGLKINEALNFDQATLDKFLETAKKQVHPFYQSQIDTIKQDVLRDAPQILENYNREIADKEANFESGLGKAREDYAQSGLTFSGARTKGELGMEAAQNRDLASLFQGYGNKLYDLGRGAEAKIGSPNTPSLGSLANYSANLSGKGGFSLGGYSSPYTQGNQIGSLNYDREADTEARRQALLKTAGESVVAGRSYQDLFN
jgi:peptidoglycan hydrolase-like protein with peptidoglycan-binding domain